MKVEHNNKLRVFKYEICITDCFMYIYVCTLLRDLKLLKEYTLIFIAFLGYLTKKVINLLSNLYLYGFTKILDFYGG